MKTLLYIAVIVALFAFSAVCGFHLMEHVRGGEDHHAVPMHHGAEHH